MNRLKALIRKFFGFSRSETNGFLILIPLMVIILYSEPTYRWWITRHPPDMSADIRQLDSLIAGLKWISPDTAKAHTEPRLVSLFYFDPNMVSADDFVKLGTSVQVASRIIRYREKGGVFRKNEDLLKMYGLDSIWYKRVKNWIRIEVKSNPTYVSAKNEHHSLPQKIMDINLADSLQLLNVYGIGPALSKRIRVFRDRLGGFVSMEQLAEVYGLDSAAVLQLKKRFIVAEDFQPRKINVNTVTKEKFKHPYIKWSEADAILSYRHQHGNFLNVDQLLEIKVLTKDWLEKARPYLAVE